MADSPIIQGSSPVPLVLGGSLIAPSPLRSSTSSSPVPAVTGFFDHLDYGGMLPNPCTTGSDCGCGGNCGSGSSTQSVTNSKKLSPGSLTVAQIISMIASAPPGVKNQILGGVLGSKSRSSNIPVPSLNPILPDDALPDPTGGGPCYGWVDNDGDGVLAPAYSTWTTVPCGSGGTEPGGGGPSGPAGGGGPQKGGGPTEPGGGSTNLATLLHWHPSPAVQAVIDLLQAALTKADPKSPTWILINLLLSKGVDSLSDDQANELVDALSSILDIASVFAIITGSASLGQIGGAAFVLMAISGGILSFAEAFEIAEAAPSVVVALFTAIVAIVTAYYLALFYNWAQNALAGYVQNIIDSIMQDFSNMSAEIQNAMREFFNFIYQHG